MINLPLYVTTPSVPTEEEYIEIFSSALRSRRLTNAGPLNHQLALRLSELIQAPFLSLTANGTVAIEVLARALGMSGNVITTPFTFPATAAALLWIGAKPVFVDIEEEYLTIDPEQVELAIDEATTGILGVHVYGNPCDVVRMDEIKRSTNLPIAYDAAHAFGVSYRNLDIARYGDGSSFSFHATKIFNCAEGGAVCSNSASLHRKVQLLSNFGIEAEDEVSEIGINAKMSEVHAAFGLASLLHFHEGLARRREICALYDEMLDGIAGVRKIRSRPHTSERLQYYVIRVGGGKRDALQQDLRACGIFARRYFFPLLTDLDVYRSACPSASKHFPNAERAAAEVLVLPLSSTMHSDDVHRVVQIIKRSLA